MKLSPKAQLFVRRAVQEVTTDPLGSSIHRLGANPWSGELSPAAGRVAIAALAHLSQAQFEPGSKPGWRRMRLPI
jgi:hypothetical protein